MKEEKHEKEEEETASIPKLSSNHRSQRLGAAEDGIAMCILVLLQRILVTKQGSIWKHTGFVLCNYTVCQAIRAALHFYLSHKKQVLISHGKTVT